MLAGKVSKDVLAGRPEGAVWRRPLGLGWVSRAKLGARLTGLLPKMQAAVNRQTRSRALRLPPPKSITRVESTVDYVHRPSVQF